MQLLPEGIDVGDGLITLSMICLSGTAGAASQTAS